MNSNEINILKDIYDNIFQNGDIILNRYDNKIDYKTQINEIQNYCDNTNLFNNKLKEILKLSENILHECYIKKEEISNIDNNIHMLIKFQYYLIYIKLKKLLGRACVQ